MATTLNAAGLYASAVRVRAGNRLSVLYANTSMVGEVHILRARAGRGDYQVAEKKLTFGNETLYYEAPLGGTDWDFIVYCFSRASGSVDVTPAEVVVANPNDDATQAELEAADAVNDAALAAHLADTADAHDASAISILDTANDFTATDVEGALAELQADAEADATALSDHIADTSDAHDASAVSVADAGGYFTGTDAEAALQEVGATKLAEVVIADNVIGAVESGKTFVLSGADGKAHTLPVMAAGLRYKFVLGTVNTNGNHTVTPTDADTINGYTISMEAVAAVVTASAADVATFVASAGAVGNWLEFYCDGAQWVVTGVQNANAGVTFGG